jgi:hypothetical protein
VLLHIPLLKAATPHHTAAALNITIAIFTDWRCRDAYTLHRKCFLTEKRKFPHTMLFKVHHDENTTECIHSHFIAINLNRTELGFSTSHLVFVAFCAVKQFIVYFPHFINVALFITKVVHSFSELYCRSRLSSFNPIRNALFSFPHTNLWDGYAAYGVSITQKCTLLMWQRLKTEHVLSQSSSLSNGVSLTHPKQAILHKSWTTQ